jgi:hypothetical protein
MRGGMSGVIVGPSSSRWSDALERVPHDVYHLPRFVDFASRNQEVGDAAAYIYEDADRLLLAPLILRPTAAVLGHEAGETRDATTPRDYGGPVASFNGKADKDFLHAAIGNMRRVLESNDIVSVYFRLHPILTLPHAVLSAHGEVVSHQESTSMDLSGSRETLWTGIRQNHRRAIRRAKLAGATVALDHHWSTFDEFFEIYKQTMVRVGAEPHWFFSRDYFFDLRETLGDKLTLRVVNLDGTVAAAGMFSREDGTAGYLYSGTLNEALPLSPLKLLLWEVACQLQDDGVKILHLGGTPSRGDSLHKFKVGFSSNLHNVASWRVVTDTARYQQLSLLAVQRAGESEFHQSGFFPAYR